LLALRFLQKLSTSRKDTTDTVGNVEPGGANLPQPSHKAMASMFLNTAFDGCGRQASRDLVIAKS